MAMPARGRDPTKAAGNRTATPRTRRITIRCSLNCQQADRTAAHIGGYASDAIPGAVTSRDRVGRLRQFLMTAGGAESVTASGGPMIMAGDNCQQPGRRLQVGRDRAHDGSRGERAWPLIMTWCPDKRAVNTKRTRRSPACTHCRALSPDNRIEPGTCGGRAIDPRSGQGGGWPRAGQGGGAREMRLGCPGRRLSCESNRRLRWPWICWTD
jgi:hypothetical protein